MRRRGVRQWLAAGLLTGVVAWGLVVPPGPVRADDEAEQAAEDEGSYAGQPTSFWIGELANRATRDIARPALLHIGEPAAPAVVRAMLAGDAELAGAAADILMKMKPSAEFRKRLLPAVAPGAASAHDGVRRATAHWIGQAGADGAEYADLLVQVASGEGRRAPATALWALGRVGVANRATLGVLRAKLREPKLLGTAVSALQALGPKAEAALPDLLDALDRVSERGSGSVFSALYVVGPQDPRLLERLDREAASEEVARRRTAAKWLGSAFAQGWDVTPRVVALLLDEDARVVQAAVGALLRKAEVLAGHVETLAKAVATCSEEVLPYIVRVVEASKVEDVRVTRALLARWSARPDDRQLEQAVRTRTGQATGDLVAALSGPPGEALAAARLLARLEKGTLDAHAEVLRRIVDDAEQPLELRSVLFPLCLSADEPWRGGPLLGAWLVAPDEARRTTAWRHAGAARADAAPAVVEGLRAESAASRLAAISLSRTYGHFRGYEEGLAACLDDADPGVAEAARAAFVERLTLEKMRDPGRYAARLIPRWVGELGSRDPDERLRALTGLVALRHHAAPARDALLAALPDPVPSNALLAVGALVAIGGHDPALVVGPLRERLEHDSAIVRAETLAILHRLGSPPEDAVARIRALEALEDGTAGLGRLAQRAVAVTAWNAPLTDLWTRLVHGKDPDAARAAARVLTYLQPIEEPVWETLRAVVADVEHPASHSVFAELGRLGEPGRALIVAGLGSSDYDRRRNAIVVIGAWPDVPDDVRQQVESIADDVQDALRSEARRIVLAWRARR